MTIKKGATPQTLMQAHEELVRSRPCSKASLPVWLSYYQRSAEVYQKIAKSDPTHEGEALYWHNESEPERKALLRESGHTDSVRNNEKGGKQSNAGAACAR